MECTHFSNTYFAILYDILALKLSVSITTNVEPQILILAFGVHLLQVQTPCKPSCGNNYRSEVYTTEKMKSTSLSYCDAV
jgi:hypothetical protein